MRRLLCIVSGMNAGGAETFLMKIYRELDKNKYQMDFCVNTSENYYSDEINQLGGEIHIIPLKSKHPFHSFNALKNLVKEGRYNEVIRINQHALSTIDLLAAKKGGAKKLIMRSSNADSGKIVLNLLHQIFSFMPKVIPTIKMAPSMKAAEYTFGKNIRKKSNFYLIKNGLDIGTYAYCPEDRKTIRSQYNWEDCFVIGHVGRFENQKNHSFLLKIFKKIYQENSKAVLALIGNGNLKEKIEKEAVEAGIADRVFFLGIQRNVPQFLSAFDCFVFPSLYEGMPNTVIEAQVNGLRCFISDTITEEVKITDLVTMLSLNSVEDWETGIRQSVYTYPREKYADKMRIEGYEIKDCADDFVKAVWED